MRCGLPRRFYCLGVSFLIFGQSALARITPDVLMFRHYAHQARDQRGLATGESTRSTIRVRQAEFRLDMLGSLHLKGAVSAFDLSNANLELARARTAEAKDKAGILNAIAMEKVWIMRADAAERGGDSSRDIAELMVTTRKQVLKAANTYLVNIQVVSHEVNFQYERAKTLAETNSISKEELFLLRTASDELGAFIPAAEAEIAAVEASLREAETDLNEVLKQAANPPATTTALPVL